MDNAIQDFKAHMILILSCHFCILAEHIFFSADYDNTLFDKTFK